MTMMGWQLSRAPVRDAIRDLADGARRGVHWGGGTAIDIESVASSLRCRLVPLAFTLDGSRHPYLGVLLPAPDQAHKYWILYDEEQTEAEVRYTIAHELGHAVLEQTGFRSRVTGQVDKRLEETCNQFADELLVPCDVLEGSVGSPFDLVELARTLIAPCYAVFRQAIRYYTAIPWSNAAGLKYRKGRLRVVWSVSAPGDVQKRTAILAASTVAWEALTKSIRIRRDSFDHRGMATYRQWATPVDGNELVIAVARTVRRSSSIPS